MQLIDSLQAAPYVNTSRALLLVLLIASPVRADKSTEETHSAFEQLSKETREVLGPFERHWDRITPSRKKRLLDKAESPDLEERRRFKKHAEYFKNLGPQDRKRLHTAKRLFDSMPPHERKNLRQHFNSMSPEEKRRLGDSLRTMRPSLEKRAEVHSKVLNMSPEERRLYLHEIMQQGEFPE